MPPATPRRIVAPHVVLGTLPLSVIILTTERQVPAIVAERQVILILRSASGRRSENPQTVSETGHTVDFAHG